MVDSHVKKQRARLLFVKIPSVFSHGLGKKTDTDWTQGWDRLNRQDQYWETQLSR
jgi:hypothetical protein